MYEPARYSKEGYLNEKFRLFHLKDSAGLELDFHYHEFDKIIFFVSGKVDYVVEGASYNLKPGDIIFVNHHLIHKAQVDISEPYERFIVYVDTSFLQANSTAETELGTCFELAGSREFYLMRPDDEKAELLHTMFSELEKETTASEFGYDIGAKSRFLQILVQLNRMMIAASSETLSDAKEYDPRIADVLTYINDNLGTELTVEKLAAESYLSKYHFMRRFKEQTGYTVHNYIAQKRMLYASELIKKGVPANRAAAESGFGDYSTFLRSFKKMFGTTPGKFKTEYSV